MPVINLCKDRTEISVIARDTSLWHDASSLERYRLESSVATFCAALFAASFISSPTAPSLVHASRNDDASLLRSFRCEQSSRRACSGSTWLEKTTGSAGGAAHVRKVDGKCHPRGQVYRRRFETKQMQQQQPCWNKFEVLTLQTHHELSVAKPHAAGRRCSYPKSC